MSNVINENEHRQQRESLAGSFDDLVESNLLLVRTIQMAVPVIQQSSPVTKRWMQAITVCALATFGMSVATLVTVRHIRADNYTLITALTEACASKEAKR